MVVLESLSWHCRTTSCLQADGDQGSLTRRLDLVMALLQIDTVRDIWLVAPEWKPAFEGFFTIKVPQAPSCWRRQARHGRCLPSMACMGPAFVISPSYAVTSCELRVR